MHLTSDQYQTEAATQQLLVETQSDHSRAKESASMNMEITKNKKSLEAPTTVPKVQKQNDSTFKRSNIALLNAQLIVARRRWMEAKKEPKKESNPFQVSQPASLEDVDPDMEIDDDELPTFCRRLRQLRKECVHTSKDSMRWLPKAKGVRNVKPASPKKTSQFNFQIAPRSNFSFSFM